jgi:hypothetical protein
LYQPPWEYVIYADYLVRGGKSFFRSDNFDKFGRLQLPTGLYEMRHLMAKKANPNGKRRFENDLAWVSVPLSDADTHDLEQWDMSEAEMFAAIMELQSTGHSFSGKKSPNDDGFTAFAIGLSDECPNAGLGLSGYGATPRDAAMSLLYKHYILCVGEWPRAAAGQARRFR